MDNMTSNTTSLSNQSLLTDIDKYDKHTTRKNVFAACMLIMSIMGLVTNFITIGVMCKSKFKKITASLTLLILAISDCIVICKRFAILLNYALGIKYHVGASNLTSCRIWYFITCWNISFCNWLVVLLSIERLLKAAKPSKAKVWFSRGNVIKVIVGLFLFLRL